MLFRVHEVVNRCWFFFILWPVFPSIYHYIAHPYILYNVEPKQLGLVDELIKIKSAVSDANPIHFMSNSANIFLRYASYPTNSANQQQGAFVFCAQGSGQAMDV